MKRLQVLVSAPGSSHGKTTLSLLLLAWARKQGWNPQAFKSGPDFIDSQYLAETSGRPTPSLDPWFLGPAALRKHFKTWGSESGLALIEGAMGLYDGKRGGRFGAYSSAEVAQRLKVPVLLVLNARKAGPTLATQVLGLQKAGPKIHFVGVVLNQVASPKTVELLEPAIRKLTGLPVLGTLPVLPALALPQRHLGLAAPTELKAWQAAFEQALPQVEQTLNFSKIMKALKPWAQEFVLPPKRPQPEQRFRLAVARDKAFHFYYPENLALLEDLGADLVFFSPLKDPKLPKGIQGLLIGGGFPELFGQALSRQIGLRTDVRQAIAAGLPTWAECGGLMWLAESLVDLKGKAHAMVGALPATTRMTPRLQHFGYTTATVTSGHAFLPKGLRLKGHEFHHSQWEASRTCRTTWTLEQKGRSTRPEGWRLPQGLATYFHCYFPAQPASARAFIAACLKYKAVGAKPSSKLK